MRLRVPEFRPISYIDTQGMPAGDGVPPARQMLMQPGLPTRCIRSATTV